MALAEPPRYPARAQLASNTLDFLHVVGISESERDFAKVHRWRAGVGRLMAHGAFPVSDVRRDAVV